MCVPSGETPNPDAPSRGSRGDLPQQRDGPHALVSARFVGVREQLCAVGKPRIEIPIGAGWNSYRPWDEPFFIC
jgi:hypothetical protein